MAQNKIIYYWLLPIYVNYSVVISSVKLKTNNPPHFCIFLGNFLYNNYVVTVTQLEHNRLWSVREKTVMQFCDKQYIKLI